MNLQIQPNANLNIPSIVLPKQERPMSVSSTASDANSFPDMPNPIGGHQQNIQQAEHFHHRFVKFEFVVFLLLVVVMVGLLVRWLGY